MDSLETIHEMGVKANEQFVREMKAIDFAGKTGKLEEEITKLAEAARKAAHGD